MTDQIYGFFYLAGKGVLLITVILVVIFIFIKTTGAFKKKQTDNPAGKP